jgi:nucleotide-binding universal stress UspA family protein
MTSRPTVLCPVDFSEASRGALRYAAVLAEHFFAALTVLTVDDSLLVQAGNASCGAGHVERHTRQELERFVHRAFPGRTPQVAELRLRGSTGEAATEILRVASEIDADVIVMSTHGSTGLRKSMFGSTTERVLRSTHLPVLLTPASDPGPESLEDWQRDVNALLVPVDFSLSTERQLTIASGLGEALGIPLVLAHVVTATTGRADLAHFAADADAARTAEAHARLHTLARRLSPARKPELALSIGDPATELARIARERRIGAIIMALHSGSGTHQMGTVTYRLVSQTPTLVIAWPPAHPDTRFTRTPANHTAMPA